MPVSSPSEGGDRAPRWPHPPPALSGAEGLFEVYAARVFSLARRLLGREGNAEDVALAVLVQAARQLRAANTQADPDLPTRLLRATVAAALAARQTATTAPHSACGALLEAPRGEGPCPAGALERLLADADARVRTAALHALEQIGPAAATALLKGLNDSAAGIRQAAAAALPRFSALPEGTVPALVQALKDSDPRVRLAVLDALALLPVRAEVKKSAVPGLVERLKDRDARARRAAARALESIGPHAQAAVPGLIAALEDQAPEVRQAAVTALWRIEPAERNDKVLVPALVKALRDADARTRQRAAIVLSVLGRRARGAVPALVTALKDQDPRVRGSAASALAAIGPEARVAIPALREALKDTTDYVRRSARQALQKIDPEAAKNAGKPGSWPDQGGGSTGSPRQC
jgi:HEAT repeat protein